VANRTHLNVDGIAQTRFSCGQHSVDCQMAWCLKITLIAGDQIHKEVLITSNETQTSCKTSCCCKGSPVPIRLLHSITFISIAQNTGAAQIWRWTTDRLGRGGCTASASVPASHATCTGCSDRNRFDFDSYF
jgi:hypothetical protein